MSYSNMTSYANSLNNQVNSNIIQQQQFMNRNNRLPLLPAIRQQINNNQNVQTIQNHNNLTQFNPQPSFNHQMQQHQNFYQQASQQNNYQHHHENYQMQQQWGQQPQQQQTISTSHSGQLINEATNKEITELVLLFRFLIV